MNPIHRRRLPFVLAAGLVLSTMPLAAGPANVDASGVALLGYDPVAYFVESKPMKGTAERSSTDPLHDALDDRRIEIVSSVQLDWAGDLARLEQELARRGLGQDEHN